MNILRPGNEARRKLDELEALVEGAIKEIKAVENAPLPRAEAMAALRGEIESRMKNRGTVVSRLSGLTANYRPTMVDAIVAAGAEPLTLVDLAQLFGVEEIVAKVDHVIAPRVRDQTCLPSAKRAAKLNDLRTALRERQDAAEREAMRLEAQGHTILRRAELIDPEMLLETWMDAA